MMKKYLPIGTVVLLVGATKKIMITGYCQVAENNPDKVYDYRGCPFPEGVIDSRGCALFDHNQIKEVCHTGLVNDESIDLSDKLEILTKKHNK